MSTGILAEELESLVTSAYRVEVAEADGFTNVMIHDYPLPPSYNKQATTLLLRLPVSYPNGNPDMFWTEEDVLTTDGRIPSGADSVETYLGRRWRRFSWHPQGWNPGSGSMRMYLEFVDSGLAKAAKKASTWDDSDSESRAEISRS